MIEQIVAVPDLGGTESVEVIEICVAQGDRIDEGQSLIVVESDKASMDIPAPYSGVAGEISISEGDNLSEGDNILVLIVDQDNSEAMSSTEYASLTEEKPLASEEKPLAENKKPLAENHLTQAHNVMVPDLGGAESVEVIELCVAVGDQVVEGDSLLVLESDKASMDLPSPVTGTVKKILVETGATIAEGNHVFVIEGHSTSQDIPAQGSDSREKLVQEVSTETVSVKPETETVKTAAAKTAIAKTKTSVDAKSKDMHAGPAVRKLARELGVDLKKVSSSGPKQRITKEDVQSYVKELVNKPATGFAVPELPSIDFTKFGEIDHVAMTKMQKVTAANMQRSWLTVPHVTHFDKADITELEAFRQTLKPEMQKREIKISPLALVATCVAKALTLNPILNASIAVDGEHIVYKQYVHLGFAVDTEHGLFVPVIRDADKKGLWDLAAEITELAAKAKARKLRPEEMQGASFTISSLGAIGGTGFTPIVNTPEVGILGVSNTAIEPVFMDGEFKPRTQLPLALSYDHRVVNGGDAGRFMTTLTDLLSDVRRMLL